MFEFLYKFYFIAPSTLGTIHRGSRQMRLGGSAIRKTIQLALVETRSPGTSGGTPSEVPTTMGCSRLA
jgi:hypothetical protein